MSLLPIAARVVIKLHASNPTRHRRHHFKGDWRYPITNGYPMLLIMDENNLISHIDRLRTAFTNGKTLPLDWRRQQLKALKRMFTERSQDLERALYEDLRKSAVESHLTEIGLLLREIDHSLNELDKWARPLKTSTPVFLQPAKSQVIFEPFGVSLIMGAWNYPLLLTLGPLICAIAAGNATVIKPPRTAKAAFQAMAAILPQYLDADAFFVIGDDTPNDLILKQRFDKIFFTGSAATGKIVMQAAANHLTPVTLELGGKSPAIVERSANLKVAASRIVQGKFFNSGQTCVAPDYILVEESIADDLVAELVAALRKFFGPDPSISPDFSRIINTRQFDSIIKYLEDGEVVHGGEWKREELYIAPTILRNPAPDSSVMQNEIFGPILPVLTVKDIEEALVFITQREKPLALYIFSEDRSVVNRILRGSCSGGVCVNETVNHVTVSGLPFGGVGNSGMGKYHGEWGFREFSHARAVLDHETTFDPQLRYPPYNEQSANQMKKLISLQLPSALDGATSWLTRNLGNLLLRMIK